jgi:large subunit ribosomal protein L7/L12
VSGPSELGPSALSESELGEEAKATEKTAFDIKLKKYDTITKIKIIKDVRTFTNLG